jgi:hypothetical protein
MTPHLRHPLKLCDDRDPLFPVQAFFNAIGDDSLLDIMGHLAKRQGAGINDCVCSFPSDLDPTDVPFEGVRFVLFGDVAVITLEQFASWLDLVGDSYCAAHPKRAHRMTALVQEFRRTLASGSHPASSG